MKEGLPASFTEQQWQASKSSKCHFNQLSSISITITFLYFDSTEDRIQDFLNTKHMSQLSTLTLLMCSCMCVLEQCWAVKCRASRMLSRCSDTELHPHPHPGPFFKNQKDVLLTLIFCNSYMVLSHLILVCSSLETKFNLKLNSIFIFCYSNITWEHNLLIT